MNTNNLQKFLSSAGIAAAERGEMASQLTAIQAQRDDVIAEATGPQDRSAIEKLNVLASQESIALNRLKLLDRQIAGLDPSALNEAIHVRAGLIGETKALREKAIAKLTKDLSGHYESAAAIADAVAALKDRNQPPLLRKIEKALVALHGSGPHRGQTGLEFARAVLSAAERVAAIGE